jgi:hypothetical protein
MTSQQKTYQVNKMRQIRVPNRKVYPVANAAVGDTLSSEYRQKILNKYDSEYYQQAVLFLIDTKSTLTLVFLRYGSMDWDTNGEKRNIYNVLLQSPNGYYNTEFGASIRDTEEGVFPLVYSVLACLEPYVPYDDVDDFASAYGITTPSEAYGVFNAIQNESKALHKMYSAEELDALADIC